MRRAGERRSRRIKDRVDRIDYVEIRDADSLRPVERLDRPAVILAAAYVGATRLIDNMRLRVKSTERSEGWQG
jgi:pantoate--beta-alanine ligase